MVLRATLSTATGSQSAWRLTFVLLVLLAIPLAGCSGASGDDGSAEKPAGRGLEAPKFEAESMSGQQLALDAMLGMPVILNFWTTTCEPCRREIPALAAAARTHADDVLVIGVNYGESRDRVENFIDDLNADLGYPIVLDLQGEIGRLYGVAVLPTTYFIDRDGIIQYRRIGELAERHLTEGLSRVE